MTLHLPVIPCEGVPDVDHPVLLASLESLLTFAQENASQVAEPDSLSAVNRWLAGVMLGGAVVRDDPQAGRTLVICLQLRGVTAWSKIAHRVPSVRVIRAPRDDAAAGYIVLPAPRVPRFDFDAL